VPIVGPVLVHLRVIVYQLAVLAKHKRWYESPSRRLNNEGEKIFSALRADGSAFLPQCQSKCKIASCGPAQYQHHPSTFLDPPLWMYTYTATDSTISKTVRQFSSWLPPLAKKSYVRPCNIIRNTLSSEVFANILQKPSAGYTAKQEHKGLPNAQKHLASQHHALWTLS